PPALVGETDADHLFEAGNALLVVRGAGDHQLLGRVHLAVHAADPVVRAFRRAQADAERAAGPRIGFAGMQREALRAEPLLEPARLDPRGEHPLARRGEDARQAHAFALLQRADGSCHGLPWPGTMTIQPTPKRSVSMPNAGEKKVLVSGIFTWPPSARALNFFFASASVAAVTESEKPWKFG